MIEIVCPSCGAQYQVPDDSIGPEGRKVTCSSCSHKWRAYRDGQPQGRPDDWPEDTPEHTAAPEAAAAASPASAAAEPAESVAAPGGDQEHKMDAIRRMLDDLKRSSEDEPAPEPQPEAAPRSTRPEPSPRRRDDEDELDEDSGGDPLRSRIERLGNEGRPGGKEGVQASNYDAAKLRRMHEKRAKRLQKARERKRKSGAFVTGFTLVAVVAATMVGLYVLQPQIVASSPQMAPAMNEYVVTVDRYRVALDDATADWRVWVAERVGPLLGGEDEPAAGQAQDQEAPSTESTQ